MNQWYYITGTVDETNIRYYLNGEEVHTATNKNFFASNNYPLIIGRHYTNSDGGGGYHYNFSGKVDEIRFYNRSLSADEVTELYRLETNPTPEQHYYQFRLADFNIEFQDLAGNMGDPVDNTSDGSIVDIDTSIPELESVKIESSNSSTLGAKDQLARFGDNITLKVTSKEPLSTLEYLDEENNLIPFVSEDSSRIKWNLSRNVLLEESGIPKLELHFQDLVGNPGLKVTSTTDGSLVTIDNSKPTLSGIRLISNNDNGPQAFAKPGDNITLSFNSSETIQTPVIVLADNASLYVVDTSIDQDGTSWEVVYNVTSSESERDVSFNIAYQDIAGNIGDNRTQANSNTNRIRIDTVIPELDLVSLASNNPDNSTAMAGDNVTLTVRSREALQTLELVHEDDTLESLTPIGSDGKQWAYSREIQPGETGPVNFRLRFTDLVGNDGIEVSQTTDGSSVSIDTAIPELSSYALSVNGSSSFTAKPGDTLKVEFTTNEAITSPTIKLAGHEVTASGSGTSWSAEQVLSSSDIEGLVEVELTLTDQTGNSRTLRYPEHSNLLASYPFNGNTNDDSGNGNDLTPHGGVALTHDRFGSVRSA